VRSRPPPAAAGSTATGSSTQVTGDAATAHGCHSAPATTALIPAGEGCTHQDNQSTPAQHATSADNLGYDAHSTVLNAKAATAADLVPPDFRRHCVAVALWGSNLTAVWKLTARTAIHLDAAMSSRATHLASWLPGNHLCRTHSAAFPVLVFRQASAGAGCKQSLHSLNMCKKLHWR
jgi:hypothetical protein